MWRYTLDALMNEILGHDLVTKTHLDMKFQHLYFLEVPYPVNGVSSVLDKILSAEWQEG